MYAYTVTPNSSKIEIEIGIAIGILITKCIFDELPIIGYILIITFFLVLTKYPHNTNLYLITS